MDKRKAIKTLEIELRYKEYEEACLQREYGDASRYSVRKHEQRAIEALKMAIAALKEKANG